MNIIPKSLPNIPKYTDGQRATLFLLVLFSVLANVIGFLYSFSKDSNAENIRILHENVEFYKEAYNKKDEECNEMKIYGRNLARDLRIKEHENTMLLIDNTRLKNINTEFMKEKINQLKSE